MYSISDENFSWKFFLQSESKEEAFIDGNSLLVYLIEIYLRLNGQIKNEILIPNLIREILITLLRILDVLFFFKYF